MSGPPETGKSHVRALMLGQKRPKERRSTAVATEADQATPDFKRLEGFVENLVDMKEMPHGCMWRVIKDDSMARFIANTLHNEDYRKFEVEDGVSDPPLRSEPKKRYKVIIDIKKQLRSMQGKPKRKRKGLNDIHLVYFVDTGGQPQFQEILPNFIKCDINLLVHNLSQGLDYCPEFNYVVDGKQYSAPEKMKLSNGEIVEQSVRSITSSISTSDSKPYIAIVGTFKDQCQPESEGYKQMLKEKSKEISERLHPYVGYKVEKCGMFSPQRGEDQKIFAIDASEQGWESNLDILDSLKSHILSNAKKNPVDVPIRYFLFLQSLLAFVKKAQKQYVTLDECYNVAATSDIAMTKSDVKKALQLFNDCNLILYFPNTLEHVIFVKPGFLYGMVTDLIVSSFQCVSDIMTEEHIHFQKTGIFTRRILDGISSLQLSDKSFTQQNFLKLLKDLFIIAEVDVGEYFMPCVLPIENSSGEELVECMKSNGIDGPLIFSFPHKMSPRGLFCALVVALASNFTWNLSPLSDGVYRCRNLVEFELWQLEDRHTSRIGQVTIFDKKSHLEVYTTCDRVFCPSVKDTVYEAFKKACDNMNYQDKITIGLLCHRCNEPKVHSTEVIQLPDGGLRKERCSLNHTKRLIPLTPERLVWFNDTSSPSKCLHSLFLT